ncbi:Pentatricopeptide repeat-containing protein [Glycine max]|nr:Pentatricopeptide repeat-containing protein [Glycine max]
MNAKGVAPVNSTYGTLINAYSKGGLKEEALARLQRMQSQGMEPDEVKKHDWRLTYSGFPLELVVCLFIGYMVEAMIGAFQSQYLELLLYYKYWSEQKRGHSAEPPQHLKQTLSLIPIFFSALSARFGSSDLRFSIILFVILRYVIACVPVLLAWYPCKFCCSRFEGEGVTLKFLSCLIRLLSIWEQLSCLESIFLLLEKITDPHPRELAVCIARHIRNSFSFLVAVGHLPLYLREILQGHKLP